MSIVPLDNLSVFSIFIGTFVFILVVFEIGYQIGKHFRSYGENKNDTTQGPMVGGVMTMLVFVLAFIFSMSASRFDDRKMNLLYEVNAITSAYLRADVLAQPRRTEIKRLLREYVNIRLQAIEENNIEMGITKSIELQQRLWSLVTEVEQQNLNALNPMLIRSVNNMITLHERRVDAAIRDRIPGNIWFTLFAIMAFSMLTIGTQTGLIKTRRLIQVVPAVLALTALITLVVDLDRPSQLGQIKIDQGAMIDLQKRMNQAK